ncbi:MAG: phage/plasmid primase, P4 family [Betaproteobacteria bacterium]|nr:phage/plasmid primase, P4 family [Betaproteobacteria bacterium]
MQTPAPAAEEKSGQGAEILPPPNAARERIIERTIAHLGGELIDAADPYLAAEQFLGRFFPTLRHWQHGFYALEGTRYVELPLSDLRERIYKACCVGERSPKKKHVDDMIDALRAAANLSDRTSPPSWIEPQPGDPDPAELVAVANGLLELGAGELRPASARFFTLHALPFAYDAAAASPEQWLRFLDQVLDEDSIATLQEWFGYCLTLDTSQQKALLVVGPKRSGKGTLARVLTALLGRSSVASPTLASLGLPFGLQSLIGKVLALISDVRLGGRIDQQTIVENLLRISGEDQVSIPRKFLADYTGTLPTRFMLLTNEAPRLTDASGALASRFLVIRMTASFYGREDPQLTARLLGELPGILNWALAGLASLRDRGSFRQPDSARELLEEINVLAAPMLAFLDEAVDDSDPSAEELEPKQLYAAWCHWCRDNGREHPGSLQTFGRDLRAIRPGLQIKQPRNKTGDGRQRRVYAGMRLRFEAR